MLLLIATWNVSFQIWICGFLILSIHFGVNLPNTKFQELIKIN